MPNCPYCSKAFGRISALQNHSAFCAIRHQGKYYQGALKDIPLDRVSRTEIEIFMERLSDTPAAANHALAALSVAFEFDMQRVTDHLYKGSNNPCIRVTKYPIQRDKKYLEIEKVNEIMDYIKANQFRDPHFLTYWSLLIQVGERQSDLRNTTVLEVIIAVIIVVILVIQFI